MSIEKTFTKIKLNSLNEFSHDQQNLTLLSFVTILITQFTKQFVYKKKKFIYKNGGSTIHLGTKWKTLLKKKFGKGGIRTLGSFEATSVFKTEAIDHSATFPYYKYNSNGKTCQFFKSRPRTVLSEGVGMMFGTQMKWEKWTAFSFLD